MMTVITLPSSADRTVEIERLAALDTTQYETARNDAATRLGFRATILDKLREQKRREMKLDTPKADNAGQGRPLQFPELLPWPDEIDGDRIATALSATFKRYVRMADAQADTCALWVLVDWTLDKFSVAPRLCVTSPTKQCGKSTLLELIGRVCRRSVMSSSVTPAALFRAIEQYRPTLCLDENEKYLEVGSDFHALLNQGHRRGQYVIRTCGDDHELRMFDTFCLVAFARNGRVPDDLEQRSIVIELQRRLPGEALVALTDRCEDLHNLARMCLRWAEDYASEIPGVEPDMDGLINRVADNWRPLFIIAEIIGSDWPQRVRDACAALRPKDDADSTDTLLLADIRVIFDDKKADRLWSEQICEALAAMEGHKKGNTISKNQLASRLRRFKADPDGKIPIEPRTVWIGQHSKKGYRRDQFEAPWNRYLTQKRIDPPFESSGRQTLDQMGTSAIFQRVRSESDLTLRKSHKPASNERSDGLTVCNGGTKAFGEVCGYCGKPGDVYPTAYGDLEATLHPAGEKLGLLLRTIA
jgi:putative DNA primase/helicase